MESYEIAKSHFDKLSASPEGEKELSKFNETIQFELKDDESFYIGINNGKVSITKGKAPVELGNMVTFITDRTTVKEMFSKGQLYPGIADFMFAGKVWIKAPKKHEKPTTSWVGKLIRMQV